jgi:hypothetical protein
MRRVLVLAVALVVLSPTMALAATWYRCGTDGVARSSCCCPAEERQHQEPSQTPEARAATCCDVEVAVTSTPLRTSVLVDHAAADAVAVPHVATDVTPPPSQTWQSEALEPPPSSRGPPAFLRHCSLLI